MNTVFVIEKENIFLLDIKKTFAEFFPGFHVQQFKGPASSVMDNTDLIIADFSCLLDLGINNIFNALKKCIAAQTPVLVVSSSANNTLCRKILETINVIDVLPKPVESRQLVASFKKYRQNSLCETRSTRKKVLQNVEESYI